MVEAGASSVTTCRFPRDMVLVSKCWPVVVAACRTGGDAPARPEPRPCGHAGQARAKTAARSNGRRPPRSGAGASCREHRRGHDDDPPVGHADLHRLADGEPGLLQPVAAEAEDRHGAGTDAFAVEALVVIVVADGETAGASGDALASRHDGIHANASGFTPSRNDRVLQHGRRAARSFSLSGIA